MTDVSDDERRQGLAEFSELLNQGTAVEAEFQDLFARRRYILSSALPVRVEPAEILPQGRPGKEEVDFLIFPRPGRQALAYGAIEIKRPQSKILSVPRKDLLVLSKDAATALAQAQKFSHSLRQRLTGAIGAPQYRLNPRQ